MSGEHRFVERRIEASVCTFVAAVCWKDDDGQAQRLRHYLWRQAWGVES